MAERLTEITNKQRIDDRVSLMGTMVENMLKCNKDSARAHDRMQELRTQFGDQLIRDYVRLSQEFMAIEVQRNELANHLNECHLRQLDNLITKAAKAMDTGDETSARESQELLNSFDATNQALSKLIGFQKDFINGYFRMCANIYAAMGNVTNLLQPTPGHNPFALFGQNAAQQAPAAAALPALSFAPVPNGGRP